MQLRFIGLAAVVLIAGAIIGYKTHLAANTQALNNQETPRVLLVANLAEADQEGDACAQIIHLVRATHDRGVAVKEVDSARQSPLIAQYHVRVVPTVLILGPSGKETSRLEGESGEVMQKLRRELAKLE